VPPRDEICNYYYYYIWAIDYGLSGSGFWELKSARNSNDTMIEVRTRTRTNTNPNDTEANAAGRSVRACVARKSKS